MVREGSAAGSVDMMYGREPLTSEIWGATITTLAQVSFFAREPRRVVFTDRFLFRCEFLPDPLSLCDRPALHRLENRGTRPRYTLPV